MPLKVPQSSLSQKCSTVEELLRKAVASFEAIYQRHPTHGYYAPGAVKLLGDHSDYGQTHVLSMVRNTKKRNALRNVCATTKCFYAVVLDFRNIGIQSGDEYGDSGSRCSEREWES